MEVFLSFSLFSLSLFVFSFSFLAFPFLSFSVSARHSFILSSFSLSLVGPLCVSVLNDDDNDHSSTLTRGSWIRSTTSTPGISTASMFCARHFIHDLLLNQRYGHNTNTQTFLGPLHDPDLQHFIHDLLLNQRHGHNINTQSGRCLCGFAESLSCVTLAACCPKKNRLSLSGGVPAGTQQSGASKGKQRKAEVVKLFGAGPVPSERPLAAPEDVGPKDLQSNTCTTWRLLASYGPCGASFSAPLRSSYAMSSPAHAEDPVAFISTAAKSLSNSHTQSETQAGSPPRFPHDLCHQAHAGTLSRFAL